MSRNGRRVDHLVIGAGVAGVSCAGELRAMGSDGSIMLVGREPHPPYHRPAVTKSYLRGEESREETLLRSASWWTDNEIELLTGVGVVELDLDAGRASLSSGEELRYAQALLAPGATPRRLPVEGADLRGIHRLGTLADVDALRDELGDAEHIVAIGGSYVACEAAASLATLGRRCTIVMLEDAPLQTVFGATVGEFLRAMLELHGITVLAGDALERYGGESGRVRTVHTKAGRSLRADLVIVGVGVVPEATLARQAGLALGESGGVRADAFLRSSHKTMFCAGDACEYDSVLHGRRLRVELQHAAAEQGVTAARNMLGEQRPHQAMPYCTAELADWLALEYLGPAVVWDEEIVRGATADGRFTVWYLDAGRIVGALMVERPDDLDHACSLIQSGTDLSPHRTTLADPDSDLGGLTGVRI